MKSIILALSALLIMAGCSGGGGSSSGEDPQNPPSGPTSGTLSGKVVDGYIANGNVFADVNGNGINDTGDIVTTTDGDGNVVVPATEVPFNTYIYVTDGTDLATNRPFHGRMSAYYTGTSLVVSPLTTMTSTLIKSGKTPEEATASVATALGVPADKVDADPMEDPEVFFAAQRVVTAVAIFAEHSTDEEVSIDSFEAAVGALADNEMDFAAAASDLGAPAEAAAQATVIDNLVQDVAEQVEQAINDGFEPEFEDVQAVVVSTLDDVVEQIEADPVATVEVPAINTINLLYDATNCVTFEKIKGLNTAENNIESALNFAGIETSGDACIEQDDGNVSFSWSSSNDAIIDDVGSLNTALYAESDVVLTVTISALDSDGSTVLATSEKSFVLRALRNANRAPVANDVTASVDEDGMTTIDINASDADGDTLSLEITQAPTNGVAVIENGKVKYTPNANFNGTDEVGYTVTDNWTTPESATATMNITINAVDDAPVLQTIVNQSVLEDSSAFSVDLNASDVDGDPITFTVSSSNDALVTVSESGSSLTLTPQLNANGSATITVVSTANGVDTTQTFSVTLNPVNDVPVFPTILDPDPLEEDRTIPLNITLTAVDVDGDTLSYTVESLNPSIITASLINENVASIVPVPNASGSADVRVSVSDGIETVEQTFTMTVTAVDDVPVLTNIAPISFDEDGSSGVINLVATDIDNDDNSIVFSATDFNTSLVSVSVSGTTLTVTGLSNAFGTTELNVTATSGLLSASQIVSITVASVNDAPRIMVPSTHAIAEDTSTGEVYFSADDNNDNGAITVTATSSDQAILADENITLVIDGSDSTFVMTPMPNANGDVTVTFTVDDGELTATDSVVLSISPVNDAPTADDFSVAVVTNTTKTIDLASHINDVDGDALTLVGFDALSGLSNSGTEFTYVNDGTEGTFLVNYTIDDGNSEQASGVMTLIVSTTPIIPIAVNDTATVEEDDTVGILIDVLANDTDATSVVVASQGALGVTTVEGSQLRYIPNLNENGMDSVTYTAISDTGHEVNATVAITITDVNDAPTIQTVNEVTVDEDTPTATFVLEIADVDNTVESLVVTATTDAEPYVTFSSATSSELVLNIAPDYNGVANVTLSVSDGNKTATQVFSLTVNAIQDAPAIVEFGNLAVAKDETLQQNVDLGSAYGENYTLEVATNSDSNIATVNVVGGVLEYTGVNLGTTTVEIRAYNDANSSLEDTYTFNINVTGNTQPTVESAVITLVAGETFSGVIVAHDADGDVLNYIVDSVPGIVTSDSFDNTTGAFTITAGSVAGQGDIVYHVEDNATMPNSASNSGTLTITVIEANTQNSDVDYGYGTKLDLTAFNALTAATIPSDTPMWGVWTSTDNGNVVIESSYIEFRPNGDHLNQFFMSDNNTSDFTYETLTGASEISTGTTYDIGNAIFKVKFIAEHNASDIESTLGISMPTGALAYEIAHIQHNAEYRLDWEPSYYDDATSSQVPYDSLASLVSLNAVVAYGTTNYQRVIVIDGNFTDNSGILVELDMSDPSNPYVLSENVGTWELQTNVEVEGVVRDIIRTSITSPVSNYNESDFERLFAMNGATIYTGDYSAAETGGHEWKYNDIAKDAILAHINGTTAASTPLVGAWAVSDGTNPFAGLVVVFDDEHYFYTQQTLGTDGSIGGVEVGAYTLSADEMEFSNAQPLINTNLGDTAVCGVLANVDVNNSTFTGINNGGSCIGNDETPVNLARIAQTDTHPEAGAWILENPSVSGVEFTLIVMDGVGKYMFSYVSSEDTVTGVNMTEFGNYVMEVDGSITFTADAMSNFSAVCTDGDISGCDTVAGDSNADEGFNPSSNMTIDLSGDGNQVTMDGSFTFERVRTTTSSTSGGSSGSSGGTLSIDLNNLDGTVVYGTYFDDAGSSCQTARSVFRLTFHDTNLVDVYALDGSETTNDVPYTVLGENGLQMQGQEVTYFTDATDSGLSYFMTSYDTTDRTYYFTDQTTAENFVSPVCPISDYFTQLDGAKFYGVYFGDDMGDSCGDVRNVFELSYKPGSVVDVTVLQGSDSNGSDIPYSVVGSETLQLSGDAPATFTQTSSKTYFMTSPDGSGPDKVYYFLDQNTAENYDPLCP